MEEKRRKYYIDVLRIVAIFMVYFVHTADRGMTYYTIAEDTFSCWLGMLFNIVTSAGPTVFFLISGVLLLNRKNKIDKNYFVRVGKYVAVILFADLFQIIYQIFTKPDYLKNPAGDIIESIYAGDIVTPYWFLHAYLAFLLMLPLLQTLVRNLDQRAFLFFGGIYIFLEFFLVLLEFVLKSERINLSPAMFDMTVFAPMTGYFLEYRVGEERYQKKTSLAVHLLLLFSLIVSLVYFRYRQACIPGIYVMLAAGFYWNLRVLMQKRNFNQTVRKLLKTGADGGLVVYLLDPQMHDLTVGIYDHLTGMGMPWWVAVFCWIFAAILCGMVISWILHKIPGVRKIV